MRLGEGGLVALDALERTRDLAVLIH